MNEYIIVGDTEEYNGCLVYTCGTDKSFAEQVLTKMLAVPTEQDKKVMETHSNLRVEEVQPEYCWWNDSFLAN